MKKRLHKKLRLAPLRRRLKAEGFKTSDAKYIARCFNGSFAAYGLSRIRHSMGLYKQSYGQVIR